MGNDIETKDKIEPQRTHPTRKAKTYDNNNFNIFCRQMGSGMSYSIEDAKSRYQCKRLTFSRMCRSRKLPYSPGHWEFMLVCSFPHPFWKFQFSCSLSTTNFSFQYHPPPPPPPQRFRVFLHGMGTPVLVLGSDNLGFNILKST